MTTLHDRIAFRSYLAWEAADWPEGQHEAHWLAAEAVELTISSNLEAAAASIRAIEDAKAAKRRAAALKGAATRRANRERAADHLAADMNARMDRVAAHDAVSRAAAH